VVKQNTFRRNLGYDRGQTEDGLVTLYDIHPGNGKSLICGGRMGALRAAWEQKFIRIPTRAVEVGLKNLGLKNLKSLIFLFLEFLTYCVKK